MGIVSLILKQTLKIIKKKNNARFRDSILQLMNGREYIDVWRVVCNGDKRFTWRLKNPRQQARLDVFIVSSDIYNIVTEFDIKAGYKTDHSRVILIYNLHNIHKSDIHFTIEDSLLLETILMNIKGLTIQYAARKSEKLPRV